MTIVIMRITVRTNINERHDKQVKMTVLAAIEVHNTNLYIYIKKNDLY